MSAPTDALARRPALLALVAMVGVLAWGEVVHARSHRRGLGSPPARVGQEAVVVLGFRDRGPRANALNRYRVRAALRSVSPEAESTVLVLCGGSVGGDVPEAELLRAHAVDDLGWTGPVRLETESTTTWENIRGAVPLIEGADTIRLVSNSLHAEKARAYLRRQRPDLAARLAPADEHRLGEITWLKPVLAAVGLRKLRALR